MRALIILNGDITLPPRDDYDKVYCCDGAFDRVGDYAVDIFVGDGDSVTREVNIPRKDLERAKDYTDGEFATRLALSEGAKSIDFVGALGGERFDQVLGNFVLLNICCSALVTARIIDQTCSIRILSGWDSYPSAGIKYVSMVPLYGMAHIMRAEGLKYPIRDLTLNPTDTVGVSNMPIADTFSIDVDSGRVCLVFHYALEVQNNEQN